MTQFRQIDNQLFELVAPVPLTQDAELPCLVRLIADDSPMGLHNKQTHSFTIRHGNDALFVNELSYDYMCFEIIGIPVAEGSAKWAYYSAQQGNYVFHPVLGAEEYFWWNTEKNCISCKSCDLPADRFFTCFMLSGIQDTGWQIYEPQPAYQVGDWVEHKKSKEQGMITYISSDDYDAIEVKLYDQDELETYTKRDFNDDFRKLSPSEVKVSITLEGTVEKASYGENDFRLRYGDGFYDHYIIDFVHLTEPDRDLVKSLLKAQEEK